MTFTWHKINFTCLKVTKNTVLCEYILYLGIRVYEGNKAVLPLTFS